MKKLVLVTFLLLPMISFAGPGHGHSHSHGHTKAVSIEETKKIAMKHVNRLVKANKIDKSWTSATYDKSIKKKFNGQTEWVVTFNNDKGVKGKKLFIFLKLSGKFVAANFSGK
jgi:hypothetical protein